MSDESEEYVTGSEEEEEEEEEEVSGEEDEDVSGNEEESEVEGEEEEQEEEETDEERDGEEDSELPDSAEEEESEEDLPPRRRKSKRKQSKLTRTPIKEQAPEPEQPAPYFTTEMRPVEMSPLETIRAISSELDSLADYLSSVFPTFNSHGLGDYNTPKMSPERSDGFEVRDYAPVEAHPAYNFNSYTRNVPLPRPVRRETHQESPWDITQLYNRQNPVKTSILSESDAPISLVKASRPLSVPKYRAPPYY